jgi:hypothetical protein
MCSGSTRHYGLGRVRALALSGRYAVTYRVQRYIAAQSWDSGCVGECLGALKRNDLHKSLPDSQRPGSRLDVYRPWLRGQRMYVKFTLDEDGVLYVLSFCRDGDSH